MATQVKTFVFTSDAESFADDNQSANITFSWISDDGSPSVGCVEFAFSGSMSSEFEKAVLSGVTWEDLGVEAGATITSVQVTGVNRSFTENNKVTAFTTTWWIYAAGTTNNALTDYLWYEDVGTADFTWAAGSAGSNVSVSGPYQSSDTSLDIALTVTQSASGGNNSAYRLDTIELTITYTPAPTSPPTTLAPTTLSSTTAAPTTLAPIYSSRGIGRGLIRGVYR